MNLFCFSLVRLLTLCIYGNLPFLLNGARLTHSFECRPRWLCCFALNPICSASVLLPLSLLSSQMTRSVMQFKFVDACVHKTTGGKQKESVDEHQGHIWSLRCCSNSSSSSCQDTRGRKMGLFRQMLEINIRDLFELTSCCGGRRLELCDDT